MHYTHQKKDLASQLRIMATHPLQRLSSPSRTISLLFHSLGIASFSYNLHYLTTWKTAVDDAYGWHFQFLTILSLIASLVVFGLGALADVTANTSLFRAKNALSAIVTPLEFLVTLLYFGISAVDPTMVVPPEFQIPLLVDLGFHFAPAVFLSLDALILSPPWTASASTVMALSTLISLAYWYWVEICFTHNG